MAELHTHGSKAVIDAIHKALEDTKKCRIAEPGEFEPTWSETNLMASSGYYSQEMCIANVEGVKAAYLRGGRRVS